MSETPGRYLQTPVIIGIDPGKSGGIAIRHGNQAIVHPMPIAGKELDLSALADLISKAHPDVVVIEKVHSMPGQGVTSMFTFGCGYGAIQGITAALKLRTELVAPQTWKSSVLKGTKKDKDAAIAYCRRAFPDVPLVLARCRKPHDGIADALCLSEYGIRTFMLQHSPNGVIHACSSGNPLASGS